MTSPLPTQPDGVKTPLRAPFEAFEKKFWEHYPIDHSVKFHGSTEVVPMLQYVYELERKINERI